LYAGKASRESIPFFRMLAQSGDELRARALRITAAAPAGEIVQMQGRVGGGSLPQARIPSVGIALASAQPDELASRLRRGTPPIVARIEQGRVLLDLRTVAPQHDDAIAAALTNA
jgi:L-seryl-tRNA(Ser) seleniumtransferase